MDCRTFDRNQLGFVDGSLADALVVEMQLHLTACERCARRDTAFRRGLLVLRNLPEIQPSAGFQERLEARLRAGAAGDDVASPGWPRTVPGFGAMAAAAMGVIAAGYLTFAAVGGGDPYEPMLAPVIASQPAPLEAQFFDHVVMMPVAAGLPTWSSALMVEQGPVQLMTAEMQLATWFWEGR